jgi:FAR1 DNA-binding domain
MQTSGRTHSECVPFSPLVPITVSLIAEMSPGGSHPSAMLHQTDATPGPSAPTPGQDTETPDAETLANYKRGSFHYDRANGILPLEWPKLAAFDAWHRNEELAHSIELIKSTIASSRQVWTLRRIFVCSRENGGGRYKYVKKHPEQKRKIPSKKTDCPCNIVIKCYLDMERILGRYEREHNHPIGIANVPFTCLSARSRKRMQDMVSQKIDPREIVCKNIYKIFITHVSLIGTS